MFSMALPPEERLCQGFIPAADKDCDTILRRMERTNPANMKKMSFSDERLNGKLFTFIERNFRSP